MLIYEYQAKEILRQLGIKIPSGEVGQNSKEIIEIVKKLSPPVVLKAQVLSGGRGKAGGIILLKNQEEAEYRIQDLIGKKLFTNQTGTEGLEVRKILVEKAIKMAKEFYLGLTVDRRKEKLAAIVSLKGGLEIEAVSQDNPELIKKEYFYPDTGLLSFQQRNLAYFLELQGDSFNLFLDYLEKLTDFFLTHDLKLLEINPLALTEDRELVAIDAKMDFDDGGLPRHQEISRLEDLSGVSAEEIEARQYHLNYLRMKGQIGCLVNGAGLAMATMDLIKLFGGEPANFLDIGGGVTEEAVGKAFEILIKDVQVKVALINIFGGIVRCDLVAKGITDYAKKISLKKPVVARLEGTKVIEGKKILSESGLPFYLVDDFEKAAELAVSLSQKSNNSG
ncbi:MAG: ADP-forming succinate--CoA ligase subunit beta [Candidatus Saccharicenans sp.]|nr:MAG: ADP-forming succinate--CoA ligase subunit beta [Candidatus Aminicenantes bacterium]HEK85211.1 ADP-forming succinate--CoA ligase subunit beta [Candidatus Aminicenantes bacterium]